MSTQATQSFIGILSAEGYYKTASHMREQIRGNLTNMMMYHPAIATNYAFACELYLKSLLAETCVSFARDHKLHELYRLLPAEIKAELETIYTTESVGPATTASALTLEENLLLHNDAFVAHRYPYEHNDHRSPVDYNAIAQLGTALHIICVRHFPEIEEETNHAD